jgi:hypothetical protein
MQSGFLKSKAELRLVTNRNRQERGIGINSPCLSPFTSALGPILSLP